MTNFEKWKATLTAEKFLAHAWDFDCDVCPARDWCLHDRCEDTFLWWANAEAEPEEDAK